MATTYVGLDYSGVLLLSADSSRNSHRRESRCQDGMDAVDRVCSVVWGSQAALTSRCTSLKAHTDVTNSAASASVEPFMIGCQTGVGVIGLYILHCRSRTARQL
jgi:hypothetical protein